LNDNDDEEGHDECGDDGFAGGDVFDDGMVVVMLVMMIMEKENILMISR